MFNQIFKKNLKIGRRITCHYCFKAPGDIDNLFDNNIIPPNPLFIILTRPKEHIMKQC